MAANVQPTAVAVTNLVGFDLSGVEMAFWVDGAGADRHPTTVADVTAHPGMIEWRALSGAAVEAGDRVRFLADGRRVRVTTGYAVVVRGLPQVMNPGRYQSRGSYGWSDAKPGVWSVQAVTR